MAFVWSKAFGVPFLLSGVVVKKLFLVFSILLLACVFYFIDFDSFIAALLSFPLSTVLGVFLLFFLNFIVVTIRYWRVLRHFGYGINFLDVALSLIHI